MRVSWNSKKSDEFPVSNGVRQGGVLSPILFTVYIIVDDLLLELERQGIGCYWNKHFVGAICYADDITLLAPSPSALRLMLNTCSSFVTSHNLIFNADLFGFPVLLNPFQQAFSSIAAILAFELN